MISNLRRARYSAELGRYLALLVLAAIFLFPLAWMISGSLKPLAQIFTLPVEWIPNPVMWSNYPNAFNAIHFGRPLLNSAIVTSSQIVINLAVSTLAGFGFAKYRFPGKEALFVGILAMTLLPLQVIMIPLFIVVKTLGWIDTYQGLILPTAVSPFAIFLMRQFISSIPDDYIDAARLDGASELRIFRSVVLPLCKPALITVAVMVGLTSWDEFLWPLIVVSSPDLVTAPLAISYLRTLYQTPTHYLLAIAMVLTLPPVIAFLGGQRYILSGIAQTGVKG